ncbi:MAG: nitrous oxide reductase accessory protein NosL [Bacteroidales bacterium]|nr:nitrous oxide reductase accessory protein NosL [Bacteroidales bacterium]
MKKIFLSAVVILVFVACSVGPEKINYGEDHCVNCEMTIMDKRYGTEIVTAKGKVYKFDSVECLVEYLKGNKVSNENVKLVLVTPFNHPEQLVDASTSQVLHCKNLPSPMGRYLTAFQDEGEALPFREQFGGVLFSWDNLLLEFGNLH